MGGAAWLTTPGRPPAAPAPSPCPAMPIPTGWRHSALEKRVLSGRSIEESGCRLLLAGMSRPARQAGGAIKGPGRSPALLDALR